MGITTAKALLGSALLLLAAFATPLATSQTNTGTIVGSDQLIAFAFAVAFFFCWFSAQKTLVKPPSRISDVENPKPNLRNPAPIQPFRASSPPKNKSKNRGMFTPSNWLHC
jgi:hypothetical protein